MFPELAEIKRLRKMHNLTQSKLAKLSQVSQSLIAKVESGRIDPTYTNVKRIFEVLNGLSEQKEHKAEEFMVKRIISCTSDESVTSAIKKMKTYGISQLPVIDRGIATGQVTETNLIDALATEKDVTKMNVSELMQQAPPIVSRKTPRKIILDLLRYSPLVLIAENGHLKGVITKQDILRLGQ